MATEMPTHKVLAGVKTLKQAEDFFADASMKTKPDEFQDELATGLSATANALMDIVQSLSARIERLHQKIDRIEKKIGSA